MYYTSRSVYEFISRQTNDPIVERKTCAVSGQPFAIFQSDLDFYTKISPTFAGQRFQIPTPTLCPEERQRRRLLFRNERKLYKRKCDATGETIISMHSPDKMYKVYEQSYWWSDNRDPLEYGITINQWYTFTKYFQQLRNSVPSLSLYNEYSSLDNCVYINCSWRSKDSYMAIDSWEITNCLRSNKVYHSHYLLDSFNIDYCEQIYESISCIHCQNLFYAIESSYCSDCMYINNCDNCHHCLCSMNLKHQSFCILNKQYDEIQYNEITRKFLTDNDFRQSILLEYSKLLSTMPIKAMASVGSTNVIGHNVWDSYNSFFCFDVKKVQDSRYIYWNDFDFVDCWDICIGTSVIKWYESMSVEWHTIWFCVGVWWNGTNNMRYCYYCRNSSNCFWCVGLRNKSYCIFNKQYTKEEYETTVAKIITHMQETWERGEFFHPLLSPFGYNETVANEYFPLTRDEALVRWYKRQENNYDPVIPEWAKVIDWKVVKEGPKEDEQILKSIFVCEISSRPYRIIKQELEFYRKHYLSLPRKHPDIRHEERIRLRPERTLYLRNCDQCNKENLSVYWTDYQWKVYCESCYQQRVYW